MKVTLKEANLYNCEGFMSEIDLVNKINNHFKTPKYGMTLDGLTDLEPRAFFLPDGDGNPLFTEKEVKKIIKLLDNLGCVLRNHVYGYKFNTIGEITQRPNIDWGDEEDGHVATPEIEAEAEKVWEDVKDFGPETPVN